MTKDKNKPYKTNHCWKKLPIAHDFNGFRDEPLTDEEIDEVFKEIEERHAYLDRQTRNSRFTKEDWNMVIGGPAPGQEP